MSKNILNPKKHKKKIINTAQKMKFSIKDFFSKCDQIRSCSHLLKKSLLENFIFCAVKQPSEMNEILQELNTSEHDYYEALSISSDTDFLIHLKRMPNACCFTNNYFMEGLKLWKVNIDIQPVCNHYKAVTYMCAIFQKLKMKYQRP